MIWELRIVGNQRTRSVFALFDGFRTSYEIQKIEVDYDDLKGLPTWKPFRRSVSAV